MITSQATIADATITIPMYCVKCRTMVIITAPKRVVLKNDRHALKGVCPHCATSTYKIVARD
jgi:RNase P subunit RPR2